MTATGDNLRIAGNISYGAWKTIRATGGDGVTIESNHSFQHGHVLRDGVTVGLPFTAGNCCVSLEGTLRAIVSGNSTRGKRAGFVPDVYTALLIDDAASVACSGALITGNSGDGITHTVFETAGQSKNTLAYDNEGTNLSGVFSVIVRGASSIDRSAPIYETSTQVTLTGTTDAGVLASGSIAAGTMQRHYRVRITCGGTIDGAAGTKAINVLLGDAGDSTFLAGFDAASEGDWHRSFTLDFNTLQSVRFYGSVMVGGAVKSAFKRGNIDFEGKDNLVSVIGDLSDAADQINMNYFAIRVE